MMRRALIGIGLLLAVLTLVAIPFYPIWLFMMAAGAMLNSVNDPDGTVYIMYLMMAMPALLLAALWFVFLRVLRRYPPPDASTTQSS
jgi:hypothetical protein